MAGIEHPIANGVPEPKEHQNAMPRLGGVELSETDLKVASADVWALGHHKD